MTSGSNFKLYNLLHLYYWKLVNRDTSSGTKLIPLQSLLGIILFIHFT